MKTIGLDGSWDIYVDVYNNIAIKESLHRLAQDVASSVRVFGGELPRDIERGIDYNGIDGLQETLNHDILEQVYRIEGVAEATVEYERRENRVLEPTIYVKSTEGDVIEV